MGSSAGTSLVIGNLSPQTNYSYTVKAQDAAGNISAASTPLSVTTAADTAAPSVPTGLYSSEVATTSFKLNWLASTDNVSVTGYDIFKDGTQVGSTTTALNYVVTNLLPTTAYSMTVKARDAATNTSAASTALSVTTTADTTAPSAPGSLTGGTPTATGVALTWTISTDNVSVVGYNIYRDGSPAGTTTGTALTYTVSGLSPLISYNFTVKARDAALNLSAASPTWSMTTTADTAAPSAPTGLVANGVGATGFTLNWTAATDNVGVTFYYGALKDEFECPT